MLAVDFNDLNILILLSQLPNWLWHPIPQWSDVVPHHPNLLQHKPSAHLPYSSPHLSVISSISFSFPVELISLQIPNSNWQPSEQ